MEKEEPKIQDINYIQISKEYLVAEFKIKKKK